MARGITELRKHGLIGHLSISLLYAIITVGDLLENGHLFRNTPLKGDFSSTGRLTLIHDVVQLAEFWSSSHERAKGKVAPNPVIRHTILWEVVRPYFVAPLTSCILRRSRS